MLGRAKQLGDPVMSSSLIDRIQRMLKIISICEIVALLKKKN